MPRRKLIPNLGNSHTSNSNLAELVALRVERDHDLVHDASFRVPEEGGRVSLGEALRLALKVVVVLRDANGLADDHIVASRSLHHTV